VWWRFVEPAAKAKAVNVKQAHATSIAAEELKAVLDSMLEIHND